MDWKRLNLESPASYHAARSRLLFFWQRWRCWRWKGCGWRTFRRFDILRKRSNAQSRLENRNHVALRIDPGYPQGHNQCRNCDTHTPNRVSGGLGIRFDLCDNRRKHVKLTQQKINLVISCRASSLDSRAQLRDTSFSSSLCRLELSRNLGPCREIRHRWPYLGVRRSRFTPRPDTVLINWHHGVF